MGDVPEVIWMRPERLGRGPRPAYSRAQITEAAIKIADAEGLDAASMRRVAAEIGAGTMSLYRYVPRREDLLDLMVDMVNGELELPDRTSGDWRADLTLFATRARALRHRHPWLSAMTTTRATFGPNTLRALEFSVGSLDGLGLSIDEMMFLVGLVDGFVQAFAKAETDWAEEERRSGMNMDQWMQHNSAYVHLLIESGKYPIFTRIVKDARQPHMEFDARFGYGLELVLDTIASRLRT